MIRTVSLTRKMKPGRPTGSVTDSRVERSSNDADVKGDRRRGQALDMLEMRKGGYAGEAPLRSVSTSSPP